jgi:hypothetical protein
VEDGRTRDENCAPQWELQDEFAVQKNEIATLCIVERAKSGNYPPPEVGKVTVPEGAGTRADFEGTHRTGAVDEGLLEIGVLAIESTHVVDIKLEEVRGPDGEKA